MINIKNVHKSFGNREILKGIDLTVSTGSVTAILGHLAVVKPHSFVR